MARIRILSVLSALLLAACTPSNPDGASPASRGASAPGGYELLFSPAPHAFRFTVPGEPVRRGAVSERYELRSGDCGGSDCAAGRSRAEIKETKRNIRARVGRDIWFGWSFYNATNGAVSREQSLGTVIGQWKLDGDEPPVFRLIQTARGEGDWANCDPAVCNRAGDASMDVVLNLEDMRAANNWGKAQNFGDVCRLFSMAGNRGKWVDIVINTNFGPGPDGYVRVWVNGELRCNYTGQVVTSKGGWASGPGPGNRRGIFNSNTQRWNAAFGAAPKPTMIMQYDEFLTGRSRGDVDTRAREAAGVAPKD